MNEWNIIPWAIFWIALGTFIWLYKKAERKRLARRRERFRELSKKGPSKVDQVILKNYDHN